MFMSLRITCAAVLVLGIPLVKPVAASIMGFSCMFSLGTPYGLRFSNELLVNIQSNQPVNDGTIKTSGFVSC